MADEPHRPVGVKGRGDDTRLPVCGHQLRRHLRLADDDAADLLLQGPADHIRLIAADDDAVFVKGHQILPAGRQGNDDLAGEHVPDLTVLVEDLALQHRQQVVDRHLPHLRIADRRHIVVRHVSGGEHAVQGAVLIGDRQGGDPLLLHGLPAPADGSGGRERGGRVVVQIPHLGTHVGQKPRRLEAEAVQHDLSLIADLPQTGGLVAPVSQSILQRCVCHGGNHGIRVRVPVSGDVNGIHILFLSRDDPHPFRSCFFRMILCCPGAALSIASLANLLRKSSVIW